MGMFHARADRSLVSLVLRHRNPQPTDAYVLDAARVTTAACALRAALAGRAGAAHPSGLRGPPLADPGAGAVRGNFALAPAEVAAYGQPLELRPAYLSFRTAASVEATWSMTHTSTVAYPRRITTPGGAQRLARVGEGAPILSDRQVQELLETDLSEGQCSQLDAIPPLLRGRLRAAAQMAFALRVSVARVGIALPAEVQARAAHLAGLGARIRPALCRMLLAEVLATGTGAPQRLTVRAQIIHAQTVRRVRVVSSTAPEGTYTLGHLSHYQGGPHSTARSLPALLIAGPAAAHCVLSEHKFEFRIVYWMYTTGPIKRPVPFWLTAFFIAIWEDRVPASSWYPPSGSGPDVSLLASRFVMSSRRRTLSSPLWLPSGIGLRNQFSLIPD